ncbi:MAG: hypothetical protein WBP94_16335 [Rhodomicrobiaceae bacterium]
MIKHALAVALLGIGIGFTDHASVHAAPPLAGVAASSMRVADDTVVKVGCLDEIPVVQGVVAFFQLLRDEEIDYHCDRHYDGDYYDRHTYDERKYPTYKDGGYAQPKDLKGAPR